MTNSFRILCLVASIACFSLISFGQKVDIDKQRFNIARTLLPLNPQPAEITSYQVRINLSPSIRQLFSEQRIYDLIDIAGFNKSSADGQPLILDMDISDIIIGSNEVVSRKEEVKNKEGKVTRTNYYYKVNVSYSMGIAYSLASELGDPIIGNERIMSPTSSRTYSSQEFPTRAAAMKYWNDNRTALKGKLAIGHIEDACRSISNVASREIGYSKVNTGEYLWIMDSKKHPENQMHHDMTMLIIDVLKTFTFEEKPDDALEQLEPAIAYFEDLSQTSVNDKHTKRLVYSALFNLGEMYYYLDDPQRAKEYGQILIDKDIDKKDGENLVSKADRLNDLFEKNEIYSTHFVRNIPQVIQETYGGQVNNGFAGTNEKIEAPEAKFFPATVITNDGQEIEGIILNYFAKTPWNLQKGFSFVPQSKIVNGDYDKKAVEKFKPKEVEAFVISDKIYVSALYSDVSKLENANPLGMVAKPYFLELAQNGKTKLLHFREFPISAGNLSMIARDEEAKREAEPTVLILGEGEEKAENLTTKAIEDILEKKPAVFARYKKGEFSKDGKPIDTKRSVLDKLEIKTSLDENIDLDKLLEALDK